MMIALSGKMLFDHYTPPVLDTDPPPANESPPNLGLKERECRSTGMALKDIARRPSVFIPGPRYFVMWQYRFTL